MIDSDRVNKVDSREALSQFILELRDQYLMDGKDWENNTLDSFLEALSGWVEDMDGFYQNEGLPVPDQPTWKSFAEMLVAASVYE